MKLYFDDIFAVTAPGLETVCSQEIHRLLGCAVHIKKGGVSFSGGLEDLYRVNLWSRIASRILIRVGEVRADDFPDLFRKVKRLPWGRFIRPETAVMVRSSSRKSRLNQTRRISETVLSAINGALGRPFNPASTEEQMVLVRFENDHCLLSVDSSGDLLHRRGYRTEISRAPLRETLAAGILHLLDWQCGMPLYDPMCGSGTFPVEAAMIAANLAPGLHREFAFRHWPRFREGLWNNLVDEARRSVAEAKVVICGSDIDPAIVETARRNAERAGIKSIRLSQCSIADVTSPGVTGLIVSNPPYGLRLGKSEADLIDLYRLFGKVYSERFKGWRIAIFCPSETLARETGIELSLVQTLKNGGLPVHLFVAGPVNFP